MKKGFGAIDLLISLLVTTAVVMLMLRTFHNTAPVNTVTPDAVKQHVDKTVNEIENMRNETINYEMKILNENEH